MIHPTYIIEMILPFMESTKLKSIITIALILSAGVLAGLFTFTNNSSGEKVRTADGVVIDFGELESEWYHADNTDVSVRTFLDSLSESNSLQIIWEGDSIKSINGKENDATHTWNLWVINKGDTQYHKLDSYSNLISNYTVNTVSYTTADSEPIPATDYLGNSVFGLRDCHRCVSLSPSITEMVCYAGALDTIVGCDSASDYPDSFVQKKGRGEIETVADFLTVSVEKIISVNPDLVFFDGSATNTVNIARQFNSTTSISSVVLFPGSTSIVIMKNMLLIGIALGGDYEKATMEHLKSIYSVLDTLEETTSTAVQKKTGVVIMSDTGQPDWGAGKDSSVRDYIVRMNGSNGFDLLIETWAQFNAEELQSIDPDFIIVISSSYKGSTGYSDMLNAHKSSWQGLKAWKNGEIHLLYDQANDITSRLGPRFIYCTEIFAKIMYPDLFETKIPYKYIGNDYIDYIDIGKELDICV